MIDRDKIQERISIDEAQGKTVEDVYDGYEETEILFEDGSYVSIYTFSGNARDL